MCKRYGRVAFAATLNEVAVYRLSNQKVIAFPISQRKWCTCNTSRDTCIATEVYRIFSPSRQHTLRVATAPARRLSPFHLTSGQHVHNAAWMSEALECVPAACISHATKTFLAGMIPVVSHELRFVEHMLCGDEVPVPFARVLMGRFKTSVEQGSPFFDVCCAPLCTRVHMMACKGVAEVPPLAHCSVAVARPQAHAPMATGGAMVWP